jgi:iron complex outermembrane recepter protein
VFPDIHQAGVDRLFGSDVPDLADAAGNEFIPFSRAGKFVIRIRPRVEVNDPPNTSYTACLDDVWAYNPLASLSYSVKNSGTLFVTFAMKSHFPTLKDRYSYKNGQAVPNTTLQPEHTRNWSAGYSHLFSWKTTMQLDVFRSDVYDAIENATISADYSGQCPSLKDPTLCQKSVNVGKEVHQGVEFTLRSTPVSRLAVDANYSFLNRTITGPSSMQSVFPTGTPKHKVVSTASLRMPRRILLLGTFRYESGTFTTNDSGLPIPAPKFATVDFGGVVPLRTGFDLRAGVKNLFDRNYYYQEGYPEPGRNWYLLYIGIFVAFDPVLNDLVQVVRSEEVF